MEQKNIFNKIMIVLFCTVMVLGFLLGLAFFLRPERSESEKRELTKFPAFTVETFLSGAYTEQISTWFADTFPFREGLISANDFVMSLKGFGGEQFQGGTPSEGTPNTPGQENEKIEALAGFYIKGNTAYEIFYQNKDVSKRFSDMVNTAAAQLDGKATVYTMIAPLAYAYNDSVLNKVVQQGVSDPRDAINSIHASITHPNAVNVNVYDALAAHQDEYLYFRTDHHWTALGAYYAYTAYCQQAGLSAHPLSYYEECRFEGFLGTLFDKSKAPALQKDPDTVYAYVPRGTNTLHVHPKNDDPIPYTGGVVRKDTDTTYKNASAKYNCFLTSDNPADIRDNSFYISIQNPEINDGSAVVLIKNSYGNCFAPFLVDHYQYVYVIDYRYFEGSLASFVDEHNVRDVIILNNVTATSSGSLVSQMEDLVE